MKGAHVSPSELFDGSYKGRSSEWSDREMQLTRLHEEIVARREVHLSYSLAYMQSQQERRQKGNFVDIEKSRERNEKYLQDLNTKRDELYQASCNPPSPRLSTLQSNYWAMVKSMQPLWNKSLEQRETSYALGTSRSLHSARSQGSRGQKSVTIQKSPERPKSEEFGSKVKIQKPERKKSKKSSVK